MSTSLPNCAANQGSGRGKVQGAPPPALDPCPRHAPYTTPGSIWDAIHGEGWAGRLTTALATLLRESRATLLPPSRSTSVVLGTFPPPKEYGRTTERTSPQYGLRSSSGPPYLYNVNHPELGKGMTEPTYKRQICLKEERWASGMRTGFLVSALTRCSEYLSLWG